MRSSARRWEVSRLTLDACVGGLTPLLAPRPLPQVPLQHRRRVGYEVEMMQENEFAWSLRHQDVRADASVSGLDDDSAWTDLERMGVSSSMRLSTGMD